MNQIVIHEITTRENRIDYRYTIQGEWERFFNYKEAFFTEYSDGIENVPRNIAVIPLICNILPIVWLCDANIVLDELDKEFNDCINEVKQGYQAMYPKLKFGGTVTVSNLYNNRMDHQNQTAALFSGGVDSFFTLISHIDEKTTLVTLWGADITFVMKKDGILFKIMLMKQQTIMA